MVGGTFGALAGVYSAF